MAENKKISELTQSTVITGEELIPFVLEGQNKVVKAKYLKGADNLGEDFVDIGKAFEQECQVTKVQLGNGIITMMRQRDIVDFAVKWIEKNRNC